MTLFGILVLTCVIAIFVVKIRDNIRNEQGNKFFNEPLHNERYRNEEYNPELPYKRKSLLTNAERQFYWRLRGAAERYGVQVITKVRLADLIEVDRSSGVYFEKYFSKIKSKHVDFVICTTDMDVIFVMELDDYTHQRRDRIERDAFVTNALEHCGIKIVHAYGDENLDTVIANNI